MGPDCTGAVATDPHKHADMASASSRFQNPSRLSMHIQGIIYIVKKPRFFTLEPANYSVVYYQEEGQISAQGQGNPILQLIHFRLVQPDNLWILFTIYKSLVVAAQLYRLEPSRSLC